MNWDLSKYLALFVSESREHLDSLSAGLVRLERSGGAGEDPAAVVDELFRHAHSLKGMAAAMQQEGIALIAHRAEDVIGGLRARGVAPSADVVDLLLAVTDALSEMVQEAGAGGAPVAPEALAERLSGASSRMRGEEAPIEEPPAPTPAPAPAAAAPAPEASPARGRTRRLRVEVEVSEGSQVPAVRGFLVLKRLEGAGRIVSSTPAGEELRAGRMPGRTLSVELETDQPVPELERTLSQIADLARVEVREAEEPAPPPRRPRHGRRAPASRPVPFACAPRCSTSSSTCPASCSWRPRGCASSAGPCPRRGVAPTRRESTGSRPSPRICTDGSCRHA